MAKNTGDTQVTWHGHANVQIRQGGLNIIIDPFFTGNPSAVTAWNEIERPDIVLVTHLHDDHAGDAAAICREYGAVLGAAVGMVEPLVDAGLPRELALNGIGFNMGGTLRHKGASITMTEAFHAGAEGGAAGYIITLPDGFTVYHAGDTCLFANMRVWGELYDIDLALLPSGGVFTMDTRQAAKAASFLRARAVLPIHWGTFPALAGDMSDLAEALAATPLDRPCDCVILAPGGRVYF